MNIVPHHHHSCEAASSKIQRFFAEFHVGQILRSCNAYKLRGFAVMAIFLVAFEAAFQRRSFYQRKKDASESIPFERDTFYRFLNSCAIHWRKFTLLPGMAIIQKAIAPLTSGARRNVLIIDDSLFSRNRSKKVELLARVYDHVSGTYMKGFRMLTPAGATGIPSCRSATACCPRHRSSSNCRARRKTLTRAATAASSASWHSARLQK